MAVKQLSILIDPQPQRLQELIGFLNLRRVDLHFVTMVKDPAYAVLRALVPDGDTVMRILQDAGYTAFLKDVLVIQTKVGFHSVENALRVLAEQDLMVEDFVLVNSNGAGPFLIAGMQDVKAAQEALEGAGLKLLEGDALWQT